MAKPGAPAGARGLGILGVAAVGALLFDMLLLSQGLVVSMRDLLDRRGFDIRVTSRPSCRGRDRDCRAAAVTRQIAALPDVASALAIRFAEAEFVAHRRMTR